MATYYVDNVSGSDANNGTSEATPVKTWNAAAIGSGTFSPSDVLLFKSGVVYDGSVGRVAPAFTSTPTITTPFLVSTYGGTARAILDGGGTRDIGFRPAVAIDQANGPNYVTVENLEIRRYVDNGINFGEVSADGTHLNGSTVRNCYVHDLSGTTEAGIKAWGTDLTVEDCTVADVGSDGIWIQGARYVVRRCNVSEVSRTQGGNGDCVQINSNSNNGVVEYCYLDHSNNEDKQVLLLMGNNSIARFNTLIGPSVGAGALTVNLSGGAQIYGNLFLSRDGIYLLDSAGPCSVYGNVLVGVNIGVGAGVSTGIDSNATGHTYWNNAIVGFHRGIVGQGQTVRNNIIINCTDVGLYAGTGTTESHNDFFANARNMYDNLSVDVALNGADLTLDPQLDALYRPQNAALRTAGTYLGGRDYYSKKFRSPPSIGAVQYQPAHATVTRAIVARVVVARAIAARRASTWPS